MALLGNCVRLVLCSVVLVITSSPASIVTSAEYVMETVVMVDKLAVDEWERRSGKIAKVDLETELQSTLFEANEILSSSLNVRLQLKELEFLEKTFLPVSVGSNEIEANYAISLFYSRYLGVHVHKTFDLALLFTGAKLYMSEVIQLKGFASMGKMCTKQSAALIKLSGTFDDVFTTAHEIGHLFNAIHDDETRCSLNGYVMSNGKQFIDSNRYDFSNCSKKSFSELMSYLGNENCLLKTDEVTNMEAPRFGTLMTADALCKQTFNSLSYVSREHYSSGYGDNVCLGLACRENYVTKKWQTTEIPSPDGLYCGKNKQCFRGKCIVSETGKDTVSDTCPFGDQPVIEGDFPKGCGQIKSEDCPKFKDACCETCDEKNPEYSKTADDECRKLEGPNSQMLRISYSATDYVEKICSEFSCLKEPHLINRKWNTQKYRAPDGMACGKNKRCNKGQCVEQKDGNPRIDDICPFGDQPFVTGSFNKHCDDIIWRSGCKHGWEKVCCGSCNGKL